MRPVLIEILLPVEDSKAVMNARMDIINLVGRSDDGVYGGYDIEAADFDEVLRRRRPIVRDRTLEQDVIDGLLEHLSVDDAGADLARVSGPVGTAGFRREG